MALGCSADGLGAFQQVPLSALQPSLVFLTGKGSKECKEKAHPRELEAEVMRLSEAPNPENPRPTP